VDAELTASIARWKEAVEMDLLNRSAQLELADLYMKYGEPAKAVDHYLAGWLVPSEQSRDEILPKLARARQAAGDVEGAAGAWLLASRSSEPRIAESAKPHLPKRYPYASEFRRALELNPRDTLLRRDLAYLQLEVGNVEEARKEFEVIVGQDPNDLLASAQLAFLYLQRNHAAEAVSLLERGSKSAGQGPSQEAGVQSPESQARPHRDLGEQSLKQSYLEDALREFLRAYEVNPGDFEAALKIGIISNLMERDREAMRWFLIAAQSPDAGIAQQAQSSYGNLAPQYQRFTTTLWTFPFFSTRYHSAFQYSQLKTEMRLGDLPIRPYLSLRLVGDLKQRTGEASPQFLSESSLIAGIGVRAPLARGVSLWAEAGEAISYLGERPPGVPRAGPDYRGGLNWFHARGAHLGGRRSGFFHEINLDGVYVSRFDDDWIAYSQFRPGYRLPSMAAVRAQLYWNFNLTTDRNRAYWANFVETGPGVRLRLGGRDHPLDLSINFLRGVHLINDYNPRRPNYYDLRIGLWYSMAM
jgi:tetratricopeptide (TPR) repeat protein